MNNRLLLDAHLRLLTVGLLAGVSMVTMTAAADILFTGGAGADLSDPSNWEGGACPGASDVAVISVGGEPKTLTLSQPWSVGGIRLTDNSETLTIESTGAALTLGPDGLAVEPGHTSAEQGLKLKVPVVIATEQTWSLGERLLETYGTISGTATLTLSDSYGVEHYAAPDYGGTLVYSMKTINWTSVPVRLHAKGRWAKTITTPARDYTHMCSLGLSPASGERWALGDVFPAGSAYASVNDDVTFQLVSGAGTVVCAAEDKPVVPSGGYRMETSAGTFEVTGGTFPAWNYFRLVNGSTVRISGGTFSASDSGKLCIAGGDGADVQDTSDRHFVQTAGEVNTYGLAVGGDRSDWSGVMPFGEYSLGGGVLNAYRSYGWNSLGGGLILSAKNTDAASTGAPGVFTQTGGVANVDFVRFGCDNAESPNCDGFGMLRLKGGTFNLGSDGFRAGTSWNPDGTAAGEPNSAYRVTLSGGTFSPDVPVLGVQADFPPSDSPATVEPKRDMVWNAPVWGEGTLRKTGTSKLTLADAEKFTGTLDVEEGEVVIPPKADDPEAATCVRWTGDSARSYTDGKGETIAVADGEEVVEWHEANNGGQRTATRVTYKQPEGAYLPTGPTLVENAFGAHAGLRFCGNALEIPAEHNPIAGQTEWSVVLVFRSERQYWGVEWDKQSFNWRFAPGVIGYAIDWQQYDWGISLGSGSTYHLGVSYTDWDAPEGYDPDQPVAAPGASLNDGKPHVLVCTQKGVVTTINADGDLTKTNSPGRAKAAYPRQNSPCYIGFNSANTRNQTVQEDFANAAFQGVVAEIRLYDRALSADEQSALIRALSLQYADEAPIDSATDVAAAPVPAIEFDADTLTGEDGDEVALWTSVDGGKAANQGAGGWGANSAPKLTRGTFAGHNAVRFDAEAKTSLGLPNADIPWLGKKAFAVAVAFRTTTDGLDREAGDAWAEIKGRGLLSTAGMNNNNVNSLLLAFREKGTVTGSYLTTDMQWDWYQSQIVNTRKPCYLNDGAVHVAVFAYDDADGKLKLMVDGLYSQSSYAATKVQDSDQNLYIGSASPGREQLYFDGDIAAIRLFDRALSRSEMKAITDDWADRYGFVPLTGQLATRAKASGGTLGARKVAVAAGARLTGSLALGAGDRLTGAGEVAGTVTFGRGARLDFGQIPSVSELRLADGATVEVTEETLAQPADGSRIASIAGTISFDFSAVSNHPPECVRLLLVGNLAPTALSDDVTFRVTGLAGEGKSIFYDERRGGIVLKQTTGLRFILK